MNQELIEILGSILSRKGHFTLMKFTTNYRAAFWTPTSREDIQKMSVGRTPEEAIKKAMIEEVKIREDK
jgi:hypothetical protein